MTRGNLKEPQKGPVCSLRFQKKTFPLFLKDNIKLDEIPSQIKLKIYDYFILLIKSYMIQLPVLLFLDVLHQQRTSFTILVKKVLT